MPEILDTIEELGNRVSLLEEELSKRSATPKPIHNPTPYRDALVSNDCQRLSKLEFLNSEEERKKKSLEICLTHPTIHTSSDNIPHQVTQVFTSILKLEGRELDSNLKIRKSQRSNTAIVTFSDKRFKNFVFSARKQLRLSENDNDNTLFINDNLTSYNYNILMKLKNKRKSLENENNPFKSIYTHDGRVFVKLKRNNDANGTHIKTSSQLTTYLQELESSTATDN